MSAARAARRWYWQRASAAAMALFVLAHLAIITLAVRGGLSAAEILGRTRGSLAWMAFYGIFVLLVSVHAAIGLRNVLDESAPLRKAAGPAGLVAGALLLVLGWRAVAAVTLGG
ncbi:succinate dehydrogenase [Bordetella sp. BOR01]|uniref:succinate dehydrogenase n=1 Tax=Bordetella sp. BOR01 TaxID=2854779 RepID=UPI001C441049|nr:succinate dehydrogenase [Bordetella sp. BOR01]MBV7484548.1 succinate dehydrogenase [Bordetella sp. BOR01]